MEEKALAADEEEKNVTESCAEIKQSNIDGGYGWVVVAACFLVHWFLMGFLRSFGLLFVEFLEEFQAPASYTSTIMGIQSAAISITSLIVLSICLDYWSIRRLAMVGAGLSAFGVAISCVAMNIEFLIFSQSIVLGTGIGCCYGPGIVLLGKYFRKRLALANAIANTGVSAGAVTMPILVSHLLREYGLRGTLLLYSGVILQVFMCVALYRDPTKPKQYTDISKNKEELADIREIPMQELNSLTSLSSGHVSDSTPELHLHNNTVINSVSTTKTTGVFRDRSYSNKSHQYNLNLERPKLENRHYLRVQSIENGHYISRHRSTSESHNIVSNLVESMSRSTILAYASNPNLLYTSLVNLKETNSENKYTHSKKQTTLLYKLKHILDLSFFKNPIFYIVVVACPMCMCGTALGTAYLPALAKEKGMDDNQASFLLTVSGALDIVSRLVPGIITELGLMKGRHMIAIGMFLLGIIFEFTVFFDTYTLLITFACLYGLLGGVYFSLLAVLIIDLMGLDNFPKVFGFVFVFHGIASSISFPVLGALKDITGTYDSCFRLLGGFCILASITLSLEPLARRRYNKLQKRDKSNGQTYRQVPLSENVTCMHIKNGKA